MRSARFSDLSDRSCSARLPSGSVTPLWTRLFLHVDQFERAAAEIADDAVRIVDAGDDAQRGKFCLAGARQDLNAGAADALGLGDEVGTVLGVAAGRGGDGEDASDLLDAAQRPESPERRQRLGNRVLGQKARALHLAAEPAQRLLVEDGDEAARHRLIDDETNRVRTDVDDGDAGSALARSLHSRGPLWRLLAFVTAREAARRRFLERLSTARQTRIRHEIVVQIERLFAFRGLHTR